MAAAVASPIVCADMQGSFDFRSVARCGGAVIDEACNGHDDEIAQFRKDRMQAFGTEARRAAKDLLRERAGLKDLSAELVVAARLTDDVRRARGECEQISQAVRESLAATARRSKVAAATRDRFLEMQKARMDEVRREEAQLEEAHAAAAVRLAEVDRFLGLYQERLGLAVARVAPHTVRLTLTLLDEERPERKFAFSLGLAGAEAEYSVTDCQPALPAASLARCVEQLNAGAPTEAAALPAFVCRMRRAFQEVAMGTRRGC